MSRPSAITPTRSTTFAPAETRPEVRQRQGKFLVVAGWVIAVVGVVLYCAACFADETGADLGAIVFRNAIPAARTALLVVGGGTLLWIVGSLVLLDAELDVAYGGPGEGEAPEPGERHA
ncbi:MAG TPA: hypothetical protein VLD85_02030 [Anaeromyxobacteraceae bacterium]|nr:hypothetical protein [Anaeromyxobacteraceae bacterium]